MLIVTPQHFRTDWGNFVKVGHVNSFKDTRIKRLFSRSDLIVVYVVSSFTSNLNYVVYRVTMICLTKMLILLNHNLVVYLESVDGVLADRLGLVVVFIHTVPKLIPEVLRVV